MSNEVFLNECLEGPCVFLKKKFFGGHRCKMGKKINPNNPAQDSFVTIVIDRVEGRTRCDMKMTGLFGIKTH